MSGVSRPSLSLALAATVTSSAAAQLTDMKTVGGFVEDARAVLIEDVTGDGVADAIFVARKPLPSGWPRGSTVFVSRGVGDGRFDLPMATSAEAPDVTDTARTQLLAVDLDGDLDIDLVLGSWTSQHATRFHLFVNDGQGEFSLTDTLAGGTVPPRGLEQVDVDGDGLLDLHVDSVTAGYFPRLGPSSFGSYRNYVDAPLSAFEVELLDIDLDGDLDVLVGSFAAASGQPRTTRLFFNEGSFPLSLSSSVDLGATSRPVVGDLDADGVEDVVLARFGPTVLDLYQNVGGTLVSRGSLPVQVPGYDDSVLADVDSDGDRDIVLKSFSGAVLFESQGGWQFQETSLLTDVSNAEMTVVDATGDGVLDMVLTGQPLAGTWIQLFRGVIAGGAFSVGSTPVLLSESRAPGSHSTFDANGDAAADLLGHFYTLLGGAPLWVGWSQADGEGGFEQATLLEQVPLGSPPPIGADFNGDGHGDILCYALGSTELVLHAGDGAGSFSRMPNALVVPFGAEELLSADLDGDGVDDVLVRTGSGSVVSFAFGTPTGVFGDLRTVTGNFGTSVTPVPLDLNADGRLDLLFSVGSRIEAAVQSATGFFPSRSTLIDASALVLASTQLGVPTVYDWSGDGTPDLAFRGNQSLLGAEGDPGGGFLNPRPLIPQPDFVHNAFEFEEVNGDPFVDIVALRTFAIGSNFPQWYPGTAPGAFGAVNNPEGALIDDHRYQMFLADIDGDGDRDVLGGTTLRALTQTKNAFIAPLGTPYCGPAVPNSTGASATISATGSTTLGLNRFGLKATNMPSSSFGYFLVGAVQGLQPNVPGSIGTLCLGQSIGRFNGPGQIQWSGASGRFELAVDLTSLPQPTGAVSVVPGETWNFQAWYRDVAPGGGATSNFTNGLSYTF